MKQKLLETIKILTIAILALAGVAYAGPWTGPTQSFPNGNVGAPINVGSSSQTKTGAFWSQASLGTDGSGSFNGGGVYINRNAADPFIVFKRNAANAGQIRGGSDGLLVTNADASKTLLKVKYAGDEVSTNGDVRVNGGDVYMGNGNSHYYGDANNLAARMSGSFHVQGADGTGSKDVYANDYYIGKTGKWASESAGGGLTVGQSYGVALHSADDAEKIVSMGSSHKFCALTYTNTYSYQESRGVCEIYKEGTEWKLRAIWQTTKATSNPSNGVVGCTAACLD
ncbi:MAG: hypothetical protein WC757_00590 [Candidatus Paceibacterota bacterium]|jgi:hypothetical protein